MIFLKLLKNVYHRSFKRSDLKIKNRQFLFRNANLQDIQKHQLQSLKKIVKHAFNESDYYRRLYTDLGLHPSDLNELHDLKKFPIISKEDLRINKKKIRTFNNHFTNYNMTSTSGSTGEPFEFYENSNTQKNNIISYQLNLDYWGITNLSKINTLVLKRLHYKHTLDKSFFVRLKEFFRGTQIRVETHDLNLEMAKDIYEIVKKRKINLIYGFTSSINALSSYFEEINADVNIPYIVTIGEGLTVNEESLISQIFKSKIFRDYSSSECMRMGFESKIHKNMYYLDCFNYFFEFLPNANGRYDLVVSNFNNTLFPFIRYRIGDEVAIPDDSFKSEFTLPLVEVLGRELKTIRTPLGKDLTIHFFNGVLEYFSEYIVNYRIVQKNKNKIYIYLVTHKRMNQKTKSSIISRIQEYTENSMKIELKFVDTLPKTNSGKRIVMEAYNGN